MIQIFVSPRKEITSISGSEIFILLNLMPLRRRGEVKNYTVLALAQKTLAYLRVLSEVETRTYE